MRLQEKVIRQFEDAVSLESAEEFTKRTGRSSSSSASHALALARTTEEEGADDNKEHCSDALLTVRVRVLEEQLTTNAREAASEIGRLKMRILELELRGGGQQRHS